MNTILLLILILFISLLIIVWDMRKLLQRSLDIQLDLLQKVTILHNVAANEATVFDMNDVKIKKETLHLIYEIARHWAEELKPQENPDQHEDVDIKVSPDLPPIDRHLQKSTSRHYSIQKLREEMEQIRNQREEESR